jgi:hypothetical protein
MGASDADCHRQAQAAQRHCTLAWSTAQRQQLLPMLPRSNRASLDDPAHYVLECPAYNTIRDQYVHISQAAAAVAGGEDVSRAMLQLFVSGHLQELQLRYR